MIWEKGIGHPFPRLLRFILLTATRRDEAAGTTWTEIDDDVWTVPAERYKTDIDFEVPLSKAAQGILREARRIKLGEKGFVFTTNGDTPISGFSKFKAHFDGLIVGRVTQRTR